MYDLLLLLAMACTSEPTTPVAPEAEPYYIVSHAATRALRTYDVDGRWLGDLVPAGSFLPGSSQIGLSPDGERVLVATFGDSGVWQVDLGTGADLGPLGGEEHGLTGPSTVSISPDGLVLVADFLGGEVHAYDPATDAWQGPFFETGHLTNPHEIVFVDGEYLVTDFARGSITRFAADGAFVAVVDDGPELRGPLGMVPTPDGRRVLVANNLSHEVVAFNASSGRFRGTLVDGVLSYPEGLELTPDGRELLVTSAQNAAIFRVDLETGELMGQFESQDDDEGVVDVLRVDPR